MKELTYVQDHEITLESLQQEILAEDIIIQLRQSIEPFAVELRNCVRESMIRGFDRNIVKHGISAAIEEFVNVIELAENSLANSGSSKARSLEYELQMLKNSLRLYASSSEMIILEKPVPESQLIFDEYRRLQ